ncbi:MAG: tyrosine recombinase XerC [Clostridium sp.]|uniref:tyrosine recombinase XerC n=1 Tax=Clostridium sp. TaxID=1506 RepID=UPI002FC588C7
MENNDPNEIPYILNEYLGYLSTIKGKSPNTVEGYKTDLRLFIKYVYKFRNSLETPLENVCVKNVDDNFIKSITLSDIYSFIGYVNNTRHNSAAARARKTASIRGFFNYLENKRRLIVDNPAKDLESPKSVKRHPIYLTLDESKDLLESVFGTVVGRNKERDFCILALFLNCGLRLSELVGINISSIKGDILTVIGKGNKERTVYLSPICLNSISAYLSIRLKPLPGFEDALFLSEQRKRINKRTVELLVKKYAEYAGLDSNKYTPHKLRHTAATLMYKHGGVDIRALQQILGHESVATTQIYTHIDDDQLRTAVKSNPLANLNINIEKK